MREGVPVKARRLLCEDRVIVRLAVGTMIEAQVRGDSGHTYEVVHGQGRWRCDCEARGRCSHIQALMLIAAVPAEAQR